ncbi:hypothetical protein [Brackiella oedipodis]|uniref:hypothetical protein n=1 Tax=Brackiella oedipodis TaxID=124225 RepID=UPI0004902166|nr:hypothetical protein [Brackiella oedipodis]
MGKPLSRLIILIISILLIAYIAMSFYGAFTRKPVKNLPEQTTGDSQVAPEVNQDPGDNTNQDDQQTSSGEIQGAEEFATQNADTSEEPSDESGQLIRDNPELQGAVPDIPAAPDAATKSEDTTANTQSSSDDTQTESARVNNPTPAPVTPDSSSANSFEHSSQDQFPDPIFEDNAQGTSAAPSKASGNHSAFPAPIIEAEPPRFNAQPSRRAPQQPSRSNSVFPDPE